MLSRILDMIRGKPDSKTIAKDRLKLILIQDRTLVEPDILEMIRDDMMTVLTKYFDFEQSNVEMDLQRENETIAFIANVPVTSLKVRHSAPKMVNVPQREANPSHRRG